MTRLIIIAQLCAQYDAHARAGAGGAHEQQRLAAPPAVVVRGARRPSCTNAVKRTALKQK